MRNAARAFVDENFMPFCSSERVVPVCVSEGDLV